MTGQLKLASSPKAESTISKYGCHPFLKLLQRAIKGLKFAATSNQCPLKKEKKSFYGH
jgi:hypothetical protein